MRIHVSLWRVNYSTNKMACEVSFGGFTIRCRLKHIFPPLSGNFSVCHFGRCCVMTLCIERINHNNMPRPCRDQQSMQRSTIPTVSVLLYVHVKLIPLEQQVRWDKAMRKWEVRWPLRGPVSAIESNYSTSKRDLHGLWT